MGRLGDERVELGLGGAAAQGRRVPGHRLGAVDEELVELAPAGATPRGLGGRAAEEGPGLRHRAHRVALHQRRGRPAPARAVELVGLREEGVDLRVGREQSAEARAVGVIERVVRGAGARAAQGGQPRERRDEERAPARGRRGERRGAGARAPRGG